MKRKNITHYSGHEMRMVPVWWHVFISYAIYNKDGELCHTYIDTHIKGYGHARTKIDVHMERYQKALEEGRVEYCHGIFMVGD